MEIILKNQEVEAYYEPQVKEVIQEVIQEITSKKQTTFFDLTSWKVSYRELQGKDKLIYEEYQKAVNSITEEDDSEYLDFMRNLSTYQKDICFLGFSPVLHINKVDKITKEKSLVSAVDIFRLYPAETEILIGILRSEMKIIRSAISNINRQIEEYDYLVSTVSNTQVILSGTWKEKLEYTKAVTLLSKFDNEALIKKKNNLANSLEKNLTATNFLS